MGGVGSIDAGGNDGLLGEKTGPAGGCCLYPFANGDNCCSGVWGADGVPCKECGPAGKKVLPGEEGCLDGMEVLPGKECGPGGRKVLPGRENWRCGVNVLLGEEVGSDGIVGFPDKECGPAGKMPGKENCRGGVEVLPGKEAGPAGILPDEKCGLAGGCCLAGASAGKTSC